MQGILYKIYFWKGFSYVLQIDMNFICAPMLTKFYSYKKWVLQGGLLCLGTFGHEICQSLGLDCCLWGVGYVEPHELKSPLGDPPHGEMISDNFPKPI
jgi:hypothetical protein